MFVVLIWVDAVVDVSSRAPSPYSGVSQHRALVSENVRRLAIAVTKVRLQSRVVFVTDQSLSQVCTRRKCL